MIFNIIRSVIYFCLFWGINIAFAPVFAVYQNSAMSLKHVLHLWAKAQRRALHIVGIKTQYRNFIAGKYLYCGQHQSYVDAIVFLAKCPDVQCIATEDIKKFPLVGKICTNLGFLFVGNKGKNLQTLLDGVDNSRAILIFPEGRLVGVDEPLVIKSGFYHIAIQTQLPIVVFSTTMGHFSPKNQFYKKPGTAILNFANPQTINDLTLVQAKALVKQKIESLNRDIMH